MIRWLLDLGHHRYKVAAARDRALLSDSFTALPAGDNAAWPVAALRRYGPPDEIVVAAVIPAAERDAALAALYAAEPDLHAARCTQLNSPQHFAALENAYREPARLGIDRFAALVGARKTAQTPVLVADAGSALTLDAADAAGRHLGGWILPGIERSREALGRLDPTLLSAPAADPAHFGDFGTDTASAIASGLLHAQVGAIERMRRLLKRRGLWPVSVFLTGGGGAALLPLLSCEAVYDPLLVLRGMLAMASGDERA